MKRCYNVLLQAVERLLNAAVNHSTQADYLAVHREAFGELKAAYMACLGAAREQDPKWSIPVAVAHYNYREAHKPRTVTHIPDSSGLTLPQLVAGKQALYSCSEDPSFDDVRKVIAAVAQSNPTNRASR